MSMKMKSKIFSVSSMRRLLKKEGANVVSKEAIYKMLEVFEEHARTISKKAVRNAFYAGRKTIKKEDIGDAGKNN